MQQARSRISSSQQRPDSTVMAQTATANVGRKSRKGAPKSRGGCQSCKKRHSRCDERRPSCTRCFNADKDCVYPVIKGKSDVNRGALPALLPAAASRDEAHEALRSPPGLHSTNVSQETTQNVDINTGTLPLIQYAGPERTQLTNYPGTPREHQSFHYFTFRTASDLGLFSDEVLWNLVVTQVAWAEKAVRHALVAIAALHEDRLREINGLQPINSIFSVEQYLKAIRALNERLVPDKSSYQITLLNCLIFGYYELLRGSPETALMHLYSGMKLLPSYKKKYSIATSEPLRRTTSEPLVDLELARTFARLRIPALVRTPITQQVWNPLREYQVGVQRGQPFTSLRDAEDRLRPLVLHAFDPYGVAQNSTELQEEDALRDDLVLSIQDWTEQLEKYLDTSHAHNAHEIRVIRMLRLQSLVAKLWNVTGRSSQQRDYDQFIEDFQYILLMVQESLAEALSHYDTRTGIPMSQEPIGWLAQAASNRDPQADAAAQSLPGKTISQEFIERQGLELTIALYFTATKCRSPGLRREAYDLLKAHTGTLPYANIFSKIMKRSMDFEEQQCADTITEDVSTWPTERMRLKRVFFLPLYDSNRKSQTAMFIWQPNGPNTEMSNWMERFSF